jgi:hypothetical protein
VFLRALSLGTAMAVLMLRKASSRRGALELSRWRVAPFTALLLGEMIPHALVAV